MPNINDIYESKSSFLKVEDLRGQKVHVTIKASAVEAVGDDKKIVLDFQEGSGKRLALNVTNARMIAMLLGTEDYTSWVGARITLKPDITQYQGKPTHCIRVDSELLQQHTAQTIQAQVQGQASFGNIAQGNRQPEPDVVPF
jgi:hypothetical protein